MYILITDAIKMAGFVACKLYLHIAAMFTSNNSQDAPKPKPILLKKTDFVKAPLLLAHSESQALGLGLRIAAPVLELVCNRLAPSGPSRRDYLINPFTVVPVAYFPFMFPLYMRLYPGNAKPKLQHRISQDSGLVLDAIPAALPVKVRNWIPSQCYKRAESLLMEGETWDEGVYGDRLLEGPDWDVD